MEREIQKLTWTKVKKLVPHQIDTVLLPVGTVEAHGAAALGTDNLIPEKLAQMQAERLGALIAPTLNYGITRSLYRYPGSMTIQPQSYLPFVTDILNSLADNQFKHIIVLNGHGGNNSVLKEAAYSIHYHRKVFVAVIHWWLLAAELTKKYFGEAGGHAALDETACVQAIDPNLVDKTEFSDKMVYSVRDGADVFPSPGSILLYEEREGYPDFDYEKAKGYLPQVADAVGDFILMISDRWKQLGGDSK